MPPALLHLEQGTVLRVDNGVRTQLLSPNKFDDEKDSEIAEVDGGENVITNKDNEEM